MIDMKRTKADKKVERKNMEICCDPDDYPYGLRISLNKDSLKKLGVSAEDFQAGAKAKLVAEVEVVGVSTSAGSRGNRQEVDLQIVKLDLTGGKKTKGKTFLDTNAKGPGE